MKAYELQNAVPMDVESSFLSSNGIYYADDSRLRSLLGWEPRTQLRDGLRQIIDYYRPRLQDYL